MSKTVRKPNPQEQAVLESLQIRIAEPRELNRCQQLLDEHHYLGSPKPVGERLYYVVTDAQGHHPDIYLAWGKVKLTNWTQKINGLTESDFVMAAKADNLLAK